MTVFHEETVFPKHLGAYMAATAARCSTTDRHPKVVRDYLSLDADIVWAEWSTEDVLKLVAFEPLVS